LLRKSTKRIIAVVALIIVLMFIVGMMVEPLLGTKW